MKRRRYTDDEKAEALAALEANSGNVNRTARALGIPRDAIRQWAVRRGVHKRVQVMAQQKKQQLDEALEALAFKLIASVQKSLKGDADLSTLMIGLGICADKLVALRAKASGAPGQASPISFTDEQRELLIQRIVMKYSREKETSQKTARNGPTSLEAGH